ncbi:MAG: hypothetical protein NTX01_02980 [Candidatus Omnitrophica bacterium]|nr:hypothetical protein [Candidatus Omnitrophota bacterium]
MISRESPLDEIKILIKECLGQLYTKDALLFNRNNRRGICERCLVFRFAHYLQNNLTNFFVDCDFNSSFEGLIDQNGRVYQVTERPGKQIQNEDGTVTKRFVDIIVHKRIFDGNNDFICFEIKKWNNRSQSDIDKDTNNLKRLTSDYGYRYGFYLILGDTKENSQWAIFQNGHVIQENRLVFGNEN